MVLSLIKFLRYLQTPTNYKQRKAHAYNMSIHFYYFCSQFS